MPNTMRATLALGVWGFEWLGWEVTRWDTGSMGGVLDSEFS